MRARLLFSLLPGFASLAWASCAAPHLNTTSTLPPREQMLVGAWDVDIGGFERKLIMRRSDHTFEEHVIRIQDYSKPSIRYSATGTWKIDGGRFCTTYSTIGYPPYQPLVGREACERILGLTPTTVDYFPEDSPRIIELKIDETKAARLWKSPLRLVGIYKDFAVDPAYQ